MVAKTHASYMLNAHAFAAHLGYSGNDLENALAGYRTMGYKFTLDSAKVTKLGSEITIEVAV